MRSRNRNNTPLSLVLQAALELLDVMSTVDSSLTNYPDEKLLNILLYVLEYFSVKTNRSILKSTIKFLKSFERFDDPLFL